jgi:hypothetical protein
MVPGPYLQTLLTNVFSGSIYVLKEQGGLGRAVTRKTGPKNAISTCFSFFYILTNDFLGSIYVLQLFANCLALRIFFSYISNLDLENFSKM